MHNVFFLLLRIWLLFSGTAFLYSPRLQTTCRYSFVSSLHYLLELYCLLLQLPSVCLKWASNEVRIASILLRSLISRLITCICTDSKFRPPQSGRNGDRIFLRDYVQVNRAEGCYSGNALATMPRLKKKSSLPCTPCYCFVLNSPFQHRELLFAYLSSN